MKANYFRLVIKGSIILKLCVIILFSQTFKDDSLAVRAILDSNNLYYVYVDEVMTNIENNRITGLNFYNVKLSTLPPIVGNINKLKGILLDNNYLTEIPEEIGNCIDLEGLLIRTNKLESIPDEIGYCVNLDDLDLRVNQLAEIPSTIGNLNKLLRFDISANKLTELPPEIGDCDTLHSLRCTYNELTTFPDEICNLKNLWQIYASHNKLVKLPDSIGNISTLESLDFSYNKLTTLPESIVKLDLKNGIGLGWNYLDSVNLSPAVLEWLGNIYPQWHLYQYDISEIDEGESFTKKYALRILNAGSTVHYTLSEHGYISLVLYSVNGRKIDFLDKGYKSAGEHVVSFRSSGYGTGMYYLLLSTGDNLHIRKTLFLR